MLVSVIIPTYNREKLLRKTLKSVINQKYRPLEILVIDDGSTDNTEDVVNSVTGEGFSITYIRQANAGAAAARNNGIKASSGDLIQFLDSDDLLDPQKIARQVKFLSGHPDIDVVYGDWLQGEDLSSAATKSAMQHPDMITALLAGHWHPNFSYLFRRDVVMKAGLWDEKQGINDDFDFALRVALVSSQIEYLEGVTGLYRWHPYERLSRQSNIENAKCTFRILDKIDAIHQTTGKLDCAERRRALADCYWRLAVSVRLLSGELFELGLEKALKADHEFRPLNPSQAKLVSLFGYRCAVLVTATMKSLRRHAINAAVALVGRKGKIWLKRQIRRLLCKENPYDKGI